MHVRSHGGAAIAYASQAGAFSRRDGIEPPAIVPQLEAQLGGVEDELHRHAARAGMAERVGEGLLADAQHLLVPPGRQRGRSPGLREVGHDARPLGHPGDKLAPFPGRADVHGEGGRFGPLGLEFPNDGFKSLRIPGQENDFRAMPGEEAGDLFADALACPRHDSDLALQFRRMHKISHKAPRVAAQSANWFS